MGNADPPLSEEKSVAWNGVAFRVPVSWEPGRIGRRHLLFVCGDRAAFEIKWEPSAGGFSPEKTLARLRRKSDGPVEAVPVPEDWREVLAIPDLLGLAWGNRSRGLSFRCPDCGTVFLARFFDPVSPEVSRGLLSRLSHHPGAEIPYAIFDIRLMVPASFRLSGFVFDAGFYRLDFRNGRRCLTFYRWGAAKARLAETDLAGFAEKVPGCGGISHDLAGDRLISRAADVPWWGIFSPRVSAYRFRLDRERNRILAAVGTGKVDEEILERMVSLHEEG